MLSAIIICAVYVTMLFVLTKFFGVKYTDIIKNTGNIKKGIVLPVGIATALLTMYAFAFDWLPEVLSFSPRLEQPILWLVPLVAIVGIIARFTVFNAKAFDRRGILLLGVGTLLVGFSEELLVRGIAVGALQKAGYSVLITGIASSLIFGLLHFMNYFTGQDIKKTSIQVAGTIGMGLNFYITLVISGSLWLPIIAHALYDLSIMLMGPEPKIDEKSVVAKVITISTLGMFLLPVLGLFFLK